MIGEHCRHITSEGSLHSGIVFPRGLLGQAAAQFVEREGKLERQRVLRPERSVVVEYSDPLLRRNEILGIRVGGFLNKVQDGLLGRTRVPRGKGVGQNKRRQSPREKQGEDMWREFHFMRMACSDFAMICMSENLESYR